MRSFEWQQLATKYVLLCWMALFNTSFMFFRSLLDDTLPATIPEDGPITYEIIEGGSQKGKDLLVDNRGHSFNIKRKSKSTVFWGCSVRNKKMTCPASISQRGRNFVPGRHPHSHAAQPGVAVQARMAKEVSISYTNINLDIIINNNQYY